ncbi:GGDEF domain-containing protein [Aquitalea sp. LB_tupeE]|uniref:GGDEF domain-containing protein n=1 Tax=Aquitalea sp. LB_tupeE TaxID=2748078 RepID=UPI0015BC94F7|nr:GGDEF domain-containing protein [Aquitalea sp. LB_tupeE]NWK76483.1 GGDEF domain-containing protein [Aquitalea sp. LB_tupeE]
MMKNQKILEQEQQAILLSPADWLRYFTYAEQHTLGSSLCIQLMGTVSWCGALLGAPQYNGYYALSLVYLAGLVLTTWLTAKGTNIISRTCGRIAYVMVLSEALMFLLQSSPNQVIWSLAVGAVIVIAMSPLHSDPLSFMLCGVVISGQLMLRYLNVILSSSEAVWMLCLLVFPLVFGAMLNYLYLVERARGYMANLRLVDLAYVDSLTRINNRSAFLSELHQASTTSSNLPLCFMLLDVDNFKAINDQHGHAMGDCTLHGIAQRIRAIAGAACCGRLGGEEFGIFLHATPGQALQLATVINQAIASQPISGLSVSVSIGLAASEPGMTPEQLMLQADQALYQAKQAGKNRSIFYCSTKKQKNGRRGGQS